MQKKIRYEVYGRAVCKYINDNHKPCCKFSSWSSLSGVEFGTTFLKARYKITFTNKLVILFVESGEEIRDGIRMPSPSKGSVYKKFKFNVADVIDALGYPSPVTQDYMEAFAKDFGEMVYEKFLYEK